MTNQERRRAFALRLEGGSWESIGKALGYCGSTIYNDLSMCLRRPPRAPNICYPAIRKYVVEHCGGNITCFASACGVSVNSLYTVLRGAARPRKHIVDALLRTTGLPYEDAFREEEVDK